MAITGQPGATAKRCTSASRANTTAGGWLIRTSYDACLAPVAEHDELCGPPDCGCRSRATRQPDRDRRLPLGYPESATRN